jgi:branched-chain amino acid transport system permease protein
MAVLGATLLVLIAVPILAAILNQPFWINATTRILIYALVAMSLDVIVGYGAMVSFGHAAYFALGGYVAGILSTNGIDSAFVTWPAAIVASALLAAGVGALSLRTSGVYFIMITLAFGQMVYYALVGLKMFGGSDGLAVPVRSSLPLIDTGNATIFYALCVLALVGFFILASRLVESRFGMVLRGAAESEKRLTALGFPVARYRLVAFVISGAATGFAGALWADFSHFVSPDMASWERSGEFLVMIIIGGLGSLAGGLYGAAILTGFESLFSGFTDHWMLLLGIVLIVIVLFAKRGIYGVLAGRRDG